MWSLQGDPLPYTALHCSVLHCNALPYVALHCTGAREMYVMAVSLYLAFQPLVDPPRHIVRSIIDFSCMMADPSSALFYGKIWL